MSYHGYMGTSWEDYVDHYLADTVIIPPYLYRDVKYMHI